MIVVQWHITRSNKRHDFFFQGRPMAWRDGRMMKRVSRSTIQLCFPWQHRGYGFIERLTLFNQWPARRNVLGQQISLPCTCILRKISTIVNILDKDWRVLASQRTPSIPFLCKRVIRTSSSDRQKLSHDMQQAPLWELSRDFKLIIRPGKMKLCRGRACWCNFMWSRTREESMRVHRHGVWLHCFQR